MFYKLLNLNSGIIFLICLNQKKQYLGNYTIDFLLKYINQQTSLLCTIFAKTPGSLGQWLCSKENTVMSFRAKLTVTKHTIIVHKFPKDTNV